MTFRHYVDASAAGFATDLGGDATVAQCLQSRLVLGTLGGVANASPYAAVWAQPTWLTDFRADITKIDVRSLIVHGTADNILPIDATGRPLAKALPSATYVEIKNAPHGMLLTHAAEINKSLLGFLAG